MPRAEFEPAIPATKRPQTYSLDRAATGIGFYGLHLFKYFLAFLWPPSTLSRLKRQLNSPRLEDRMFAGRQLHWPLTM
jgi:hypothetical protein